MSGFWILDNKIRPLLGFITRILIRSIIEMRISILVVAFLIMRTIDIFFNLYNYITFGFTALFVICITLLYIFVVINIKQRPYLIGIMLCSLQFSLLGLPRFLKTIKIIESFIVMKHYHFGVSACVMMLSFFNIRDKRLSIISFALNIVINLFAKDYRMAFSFSTELCGTYIVWVFLRTDLMEIFVMTIRQLLIEDTVSKVTDLEILKKSIIKFSSIASFRTLIDGIKECLSFLTSPDNQFKETLNEFVNNLESFQRWMMCIRSSMLLQIFIILTNNCSCVLCLLLCLNHYNKFRLVLTVFFTGAQIVLFVHKYKSKTFEELAFGNNFVNILEKIEKVITVTIISLTITRNSIDRISFVFEYTTNKIRTTTSKISEKSAVFCKRINFFCYETGMKTFAVVKCFALEHPYWTTFLGATSVLAIMGTVLARKRNSTHIRELHIQDID